MELETDHPSKRRFEEFRLPPDCATPSRTAPTHAAPSHAAPGRTPQERPSSARHPAPDAPHSPPTRLPPQPASPVAAGSLATEVVAAHAGDHALIHGLLLAAHQSPTYHEFAARFDEPSYSPADRLLIKAGEEVLAHVQMRHRAAMFEGLRIPAGDLHDLAVLPEFASQGFEQALLQAAEEDLRNSHAVLSLVRSPHPAPLLAAGWSEARGRGYSRANVGDLLAHLAVPSAAAPRGRRDLTVRLWRHVELDAVQAVYRAATEPGWGAFFRSERYWQWLTGRGVHSEVIVAIDGPDAWDDWPPAARNPETADPPDPARRSADALRPADPASRIVGYAILNGPQILELCCLPEYEFAAPRLLKRACQDAIERDYHTLSLHTPASDPLHELIVTAGGAWCGDERGTGGPLLVKLLDAERWIELLDPLLRRRTKSAAIPRPFEIAFAAGERKWRLNLTRRSSRLVADDLADPDVTCEPRAFGDLLVGNLEIPRAIDEARLTVHHDQVAARLAALFPPKLFWQSPFDRL